MLKTLADTITTLHQAYYENNDVEDRQLLEQAILHLTALMAKVGKRIVDELPGAPLMEDGDDDAGPEACL